MILHRLKSAINREGRNELNENFDRIENGYAKVVEEFNETKTLTEEANEKSENAVVLADQANITSNYVQQQLDTVILESGDANPEVIQARAEFVNLRERLDTEFGQITTQLAQVDEQKADKTEVLNLVGNISDGTPLFADTVIGMTDTTRNYVNTTDGYVYTYDGATFVKTNVIYQATGIEEGAVDITKTEKAIRDTLRPPNIGLPIKEMAKHPSNVDYFYQDKGLFKLSRWYSTGGTIINDNVINITEKTGNIFWIDYFITDEARKWGVLSFGLKTLLTNGTVDYYLRFYNVSDEVVSTQKAVLYGNQLKFENLLIPANVQYIRIYANASVSATGELFEPVLTYGGVLGDYDESYYESVFKPTSLIGAPDLLDDSVSIEKLTEEVRTILVDSQKYWKGKTVAFLGDSITSKDYNLTKPNRYPKVLCEYFGMTELNYGIASSTIAVKEDEPNSGDPMAIRYLDMDSNADLIIVAGGTNDWFYTQTPLGTMADRSNFTFYGALHTLCLGLKKKYKGKTIMFMTPVMRRQNSYQLPTNTNGNGKTLKQYGEIIKEVCGYYSISVLDMYNESGLYPFDDEIATEYYTRQGTEGDYYYTHPNDVGQLMMAKRLIGFVSQLG